MREEGEKREQLLAALRSGEDRIARAETVVYTSGLLDRLAEGAVQNALKKKPIKNAVKP